MLPIWQTVLLYSFLAVGFGAGFRRLGPGAVFGVGALLVPFVMFVLVTFIGLGVAVSAWLLLGLAAIGWGWLSWRARSEVLSARLFFLVHPVVLMPAAFLIVAVFRGPDAAYIPHSFDETAFEGWGTWAQQILAADTWLHQEMQGPFPNYPKAWPLAIALPHVFFEPFDGTRGVTALFVFHVGVYAMIYDYVVGRVVAEAPLFRLPRLFGWSVVIVLLMASVMWSLLPVNQLIERPLLYTAAAAFVLLLRVCRSRENAEVALFGAGMMIASGFAMKTSGLLHVFPAVALAFWVGVGARQRIWFAVLAGGPFVLTWAVWSLVTVAPSPLPFHQPDIWVDVVARGLATLRYWAVYVSTYKWPVTLAALAGVFWAAWTCKSDRVAVAALLLLWLSYLGALLALYAISLPGNAIEEFPSLERYSRLPIRILHAVGLIFLALKLVVLTQTMDRFVWGRRFVPVALCLVIALGGAYQIKRTAFLMHDLSEKSEEDTKTVPYVKKMRDEMAVLRAELDARAMDLPQVIVVAQGDDGTIHNLAAYYGAGAPGSGQPQRLQVTRIWSWGGSKGNHWMKSTRPAELSALLRAQDVIWPVIVDDFVRPVLAGLASDDVCRARPEDYFFIKATPGGDAFECVPKK